MKDLQWFVTYLIAGFGCMYVCREYIGGGVMTLPAILVGLGLVLFIVWPFKK